MKRCGVAAGLEAYLAVPLVEDAIATFGIFVPPDRALAGSQECQPSICKWSDLEARGTCISGHGKSVAEQCKLCTQCELKWLRIIRRRRRGRRVSDMQFAVAAVQST